MFDVGGGELLLIVLAIILLFGKDKMPETVKMVKKGVSQARKAQAMFKEQLDEIKTAVDDIDKQPASSKDSKNNSETKLNNYKEEDLNALDERPYKPIELKVDIADNSNNENELNKDNENIH